MRVEDRWWPPTPLRRFAPKSPTAPRDGERSHDEPERRRGHERPRRVVADREAPGDLEEGAHAEHQHPNPPGAVPEGGAEGQEEERDRRQHRTLASVQ